MNVELLRQTQTAILEEPKRVNMRMWALTQSYQKELGQEPPCGTVGCIAGWIVSITQNLRGDKLAENMNIEGTATRLLGFPSFYETEILFYLSRWPWAYQQRLALTKPGTREYAEVVAARIDHFIATEGAE